MKELLVHCLITVFVLAVCHEPLFAEGTAQLIPTGSSSKCISYVQGNDGSGKEGATYGRPWYDKIYVHISDPATEIIYYGFAYKQPSSAELYYQIIDPEGAIVVTGKVGKSSSDSCFIVDDAVAAYVGPNQVAGMSSGGYDALEYTPSMEGDYMIQFNLGDPYTSGVSNKRYFVHPFDVTVADVSDPVNPTAIDGRLFSYKWHLNTNSSSNGACMEFYTWTPDSMVIAMDMNGIQAYGYTVSFNDHGPGESGDLAVDRLSSTSVSSAVPQYRVFLNNPDESAYPSGVPGEVTYVDMDGCPAEQNYCIFVNTTKAGELNVFLDLNGNGVYDVGTVDVYFPYQTDSLGQQCIPWDGIDGLGNLVSDTLAGEVMVQFAAGVVHYPVWDPENNPNGFNARIVRPITGLTPRLYYDNSNTPIGSANLTGCDSLCNIWSGKKGNNVMVNTWINSITSADTADFVMVPACPPSLINDSTCARRDASMQYAILDNDSDADNNIDTTSVMLDYSVAVGTASFNTNEGLLTFTPYAGLKADTVRIEYEVCDQTSALDGGPLCRTALLVITMDSECMFYTTLSPSSPLSDEELALDKQTWVKPFHVQGKTTVSWEYQNQLPLYLSISNVWGQKIYERELAPMDTPESIQLSMESWAAGTYYVKVYNQEYRFSQVLAR